MEPKDVSQLLVSLVAPFVAAGGALALVAFQQRERIACVITYGAAFDEYDGQTEASFLSIHNLTAQSVAISRVRYLSGFPRRPRQSGTALDYNDPSDLDFPYLIETGAIRSLRLNEHLARRMAEGVSGLAYVFAKFFRRPRIVIEVTTTAGRRRWVGAEPVLDYKDRAPWAKEF